MGKLLLALLLVALLLLVPPLHLKLRLRCLTCCGSSSQLLKHTFHNAAAYMANKREPIRLRLVRADDAISPAAEEQAPIALQADGGLMAVGACRCLDPNLGIGRPFELTHAPPTLAHHKHE